MFKWLKSFFKKQPNVQESTPNKDSSTTDTPGPKRFPGDSLDKTKQFSLNVDETLRTALNSKDSCIIIDKDNKPYLGKIGENEWQVLDRRDGKIKIIERVWVANLPVFIPKDIPTK